MLTGKQARAISQRGGFGSIDWLNLMRTRWAAATASAHGCGLERGNHGRRGRTRGRSQLSGLLGLGGFPGRPALDSNAKEYQAPTKRRNPQLCAGIEKAGVLENVSMV